jgi:hypothetical protein
MLMAMVDAMCSVIGLVRPLTEKKGISNVLSQIPKYIQCHFACKTVKRLENLYLAKSCSLQHVDQKSFLVFDILIKNR